MTSSVLRQALAFAASGWPVLPCLPGQKMPATTHGYRDATTDPDQITAWFGRHPDRNLAIATGAPGPDVLDVDDHGPAGNGYPAFRQLQEAGLLDSATVYVRSPSGGLHAYFTGTTQHCGHLPAHHLDFRSAGGYVLTRPPRSAAALTSSSPSPAAAATWTGLPLPPSCTPAASTVRFSRSRSRGPVVTWALWPAGSPPSPKATATPACSGPPTAPSRRTRPPI